MTKQLLKRFIIPFINLLGIIIIILFYLLDSLVNTIFKKWLFFIFIILSIILILAQVLLYFYKKENIEKKVKNINEYIQIALFAVIAVEILFSFIMFPATVNQTSMLPTLFPRDDLIVVRTHDLDNNDIVVFRYDETIQKANIGIENNELLIKRVIAKPGQTINYVGDKLYINGVESKDDYAVKELDGLDLYDLAVINGMDDECLQDDGSYVLPEGWYVVFGDNRQYINGGVHPISIDSRTFGLVHESQIYGRVDYIMNSIFDWDKI